MKALGDEIESEFQAKIIQLNDKIDANQADVQQQINDLKSNINQCANQSTDTDDDMQRIAKWNKLKISGITYKHDEDLTEIFTAIANLVQFDLTNVNNLPTLMRIFKQNQTTNTSLPTSIVIVKFVAKHIRNDFYRMYLNKVAAKQPIMSENIGLPSGKRLIIGKNLTPKNFEIFVEAGKHKKMGKLCQVFTQEGLVHVEADKNTKAKSIRSLIELELFIRVNPTVIQKINEHMNITNNVTSNGAHTTTPSEPTNLLSSQNPVVATLTNMQLQQQQQQQLMMSSTAK